MTISAKFRKTVIFFSLLLLSIPGCKPDYSGISLGTFGETSGEITGYSENTYGYVVYDIQDEKIVMGHNIRMAFTPASVTKLFTALFAIETLGKDHTFTTPLSYTGNISDGILHGDLYLTGGGDPELSVEGLSSLVSGLQKKQITELKGGFYYDESLFTPREKLDSEMPDEAYYNTGLSPLSFNGNIIYALQIKNSAGRIISAGMLPSLPSFSAVLYSGKPDYPFIKFSNAGGKEKWSLPDRYLWDERQPLPVKHPGMYTAQVLRHLAGINGIKLPLPVRGKNLSSSKLISEVKSRPVKDIVKDMLYTSNNLTAEIINSASSIVFLKSSDVKKDKLNAMEKFYRTCFTRICWENFRIVNSSGLSKLNRITPEQTAAVLLFIEKNRKVIPAIEELLPLSGWEGTLKNRLDGSSSSLRVYAKTGSLFYASGLAGILYGKSGKRYIFSVYINDKSKRELYDSIKEKTVGDINAGGLWSKNASEAVDRFIAKIVQEL